MAWKTGSPSVAKAAGQISQFLADCLNVPLAAVKIASGQRGRLKRIEVQGARAEQIRSAAFSHTKNHVPTIDN
jgi:uncharacterized protein YggU (UPF0235/DUF167 family)